MVAPAGSLVTARLAIAQAAARALMENTELSAREIVEKGLRIAGDICIYTNDRFTLETI